MVRLTAARRHESLAHSARLSARFSASRPIVLASWREYPAYPCSTRGRCLSASAVPRFLHEGVSVWSVAPHLTTPVQRGSWRFEVSRCAASCDALRETVLQGGRAGRVDRLRATLRLVRRLESPGHGRVDPRRHSVSICRQRCKLSATILVGLACLRWQHPVVFQKECLCREFAERWSSN